MLPAISGIEQFLSAARSVLSRRGEDVDLLHILGVPVLDDVDDGGCEMLRLETEGGVGGDPAAQTGDGLLGDVRGGVAVARGVDPARPHHGDRHPTGRHLLSH